MSDKDTQNSQYSHTKPALFLSADFFAFGYKKAEKLAAAVHLLTRAVSERESVRQLLRERSLTVVSAVVALAANGPECAEGRVRVAAAIAELETLLSIAAAAQYLSPMNASVITEEYRKLASFVEERLVAGTVPQELVFDVSGLYAEALAERAVSTTAAQAHAKGHSDQGMSFKTSVSPNAYKKSSSMGQTKVSDRKSAIISLVRRKRAVGIKDVTAVISDCSEKTVQRELLQLVEEGVLKKEGERRWSVYSLNEPTAA